MSTITCPYCSKPSRERDLLRRCGPRCDKENDAEKTFPVSTARNGKCPHGHVPQARRSCPHCGRDLLREYVESAGSSVAVIGSADSGKSTWVGVLIRELSNGAVSQRFPTMSLDLLGEHSREQYRDRFHTPLYDKGEIVRKTRSVRGELPEPLIFSLRFAKTGLLGARVRPTVTVFFDTAGEDVVAAAALDQLISYLETAQGVVLLLDPTQMPQAQRGLGLPASRTVTDQLHVVNRLAELLRERSGKSITKRLTTPLAIVLTKVDLLADSFDVQSPLRRESRHIGGFDEDDAGDVHEDVRAWLDRYYDPAFDRGVANSFATYRYFGLSALGAQPSGTELDSAGVRPYRVEDPMLWLLSRFGAVKTTRRRR